MGVKKLLLEFISSEEASIAQRSFLNVGAMLTVVMLAAVTLLVTSGAKAVPPEECHGIAEGSCAWVLIDDCPGSPCYIEGYYCNSPSRGCTRDNVRTCCPGGCEEGCENCAGCS